MEEETHADFTLRGVRGIRHSRIRYEFPHQTGCVIRHTEEISIRGREVCEPEVRQHARIRAELDIENVLALAGDGGVEGLCYLRRDDGAGDCADWLGRVVREAEFVLVGEGAQLEGICVVGEGDAGVVDFGDVEKVVDCVGVLEARLILGEGAFNVGVHAGIELIGAVQSGLILGALEVVVGADY